MLSLADEEAGKPGGITLGSVNNEPVAWMQVSAIDGTPMKASLVQTWDDDIPLYIHPAKTLTDEEIKDIGYQYCEFGLNIPMIRTILRKAQGD